MSTAPPAKHPLVEHLPAVVWAREPATLRFTFVSDAAEELLGFPAEDWRERTGFWEDRLHADDRAEAVRRLKDAVAAGGRLDIGYRMIAADGSVKWIRDVSNVTFGAGGPGHVYGVILDDTARHTAEAELRRRDRQERAQFEALAQLAREGTIHHGPLQRALERASVVSANVLELACVGYWTYLEGRTALHCLSRYEAGAGHSAGGELRAGTCPAYFLALGEDRVVAVSDAATDPRTMELGAYLRERRIRSLLDAPVRVGGKVVGVLCHEHVGECREWTEQERNFAACMADLVAHAIEAEDRRRADLAVRRSEAEFRGAFHGSPSALALADGTLRILDVNPSFEQLFAASRDALLGESLTRLIPDAVPEEAGAPAQRLRAHRADGTETCTEGVVHRLPAEGPARFLANFRDVSALVDAEEQIARYSRQLEERVAMRTEELRGANRELEAFAYSVSHDLRGPLRGIDGFACVLADTDGARLSAEGHACIARIRAATRRMAQLIDDMLRLSRVGRLDVRAAPVNVSDLAREVCAELSRAAPDREIALSIQDGIVVIGDPALLRIVLENLLANAWKFTSRQPRAHVQVGATTQGGRTTVFVRDDGAGLDPAHAASLFQPFQRLHGEAEFEGTGIGLAIVRRAVERMGGTVAAAGAVGAGATLSFTLEQAPAPVS